MHRLGQLGVSRPPHTHTHLPVFPSQSLTDLSKDALAINLVFGENLTSLMSCWCPAKAVRLITTQSTRTTLHTWIDEHNRRQIDLELHITESITPKHTQTHTVRMYYTQKHTHTYEQTYIRTQIHMFIHTHVHTQTCCQQPHTHTCTHAPTHAHRPVILASGCFLSAGSQRKSVKSSEPDTISSLPLPCRRTRGQSHALNMSYQKSCNSEQPGNKASAPPTVAACHCCSVQRCDLVDVYMTWP